MRFWQLFWAINLVVAGAAFALITVVVTVKGVKDLKEMFSRLGEQQGDGQGPPAGH